MKTRPSGGYYDREDAIDQLERYRLLVESIEDYAIFLLDEEGNVATWNIGAQKFKGYKPEEIIGKHFSTFYTPEDLATNKPARELEISKEVGRVEDEGWRVRKDGTQFWANVVITALYDKTGKHRGFAKVTRDLTERKRHEDELRDTNIKLEASYKNLQQLSDVKDEFVSLASHQLRTPATGVKQYLALVLDGFAGTIDDQQRDFLKKAYESNDRQIEIINDLLRVAQLDAGKVMLKKEKTDIGTLIESVADEQKDVFKSRQQKLSLVIPAKTIYASVDCIRFRMVIENLLDNASKYTPQKGSVSITLRQTIADTQIAIADTGVGIKRTDIGRLFEKFTRLANPETKDVTGSGLGLYWAEKIIKLHGGEIAVMSQAGKGTTFTIHVPNEEVGHG